MDLKRLERRIEGMQLLKSSKVRGIGYKAREQLEKIR